jgi:hypothetical protein
LGGDINTIKHAAEMFPLYREENGLEINIDERKYMNMT